MVTPPSPGEAGPLNGGPQWKTLLDLEELDRDLYRAFTPEELFRVTLFGGQVAAQALMAAARTVPEGRLPHSLHGYYLRPGRPDQPIILRVQRDRDGRSFSARHVVADQDGDAIFTTSLSFHRPEPAGNFQQPMPARLTPPEDIARYRGSDGIGLYLDVRQLPPGQEVTDWTGSSSRMWIRSAGPVPDDPVVQACVLTYLSDLGSGFIGLTVPGVPPGGPSLDHAIWFHRALDLNDWVLMDLWPMSAAGSRGLYLGAIWDRAGTCGATLAQESLLRPS